MPFSSPTILYKVFLSFKYRDCAKFAGIVGGLSAWGADMDIIVTISVVVAIGLTVDYAAHINYHYFVMNAMLPPIDRMSSSLQATTYATAQVKYFLVEYCFQLFVFTLLPFARSHFLLLISTLIKIEPDDSISDSKYIFFIISGCDNYIYMHFASLFL